MIDKEIGSKDVRITPQVSTTFVGTLVENQYMVVIRIYRRKKDGQVYCNEYVRKDDSPSAKRVRRVMLFRSRKGIG